MNYEKEIEEDLRRSIKDFVDVLELEDLWVVRKIVKKRSMEESGGE